MLRAPRGLRDYIMLYITGLYHGIILRHNIQDNITELYSGIVLQDNIRESYHGIVLQDNMTELYPG